MRPGGTVTAGNAAGINDGAAALVAGFGRGGGAERADAACPRARHGDRRRAAAHHGDWAGAGNPQADGAAEAQDRRLRRDRAERSLRQPGARLPPPARGRRRCRARQPERRRHRLRPSARHVGRADRRRGDAGAGRRGGRYGLATMCVGVGQGVALAVERV